MQKNLKKMFFILLLFILTGCTLGGYTKQEKIYNEDKIIQEDWYLDYDGVSEDTFIQEVNIDLALEKLKTDAGILILSSPDCPYCMTAFPVLDELSRKYKMENIYYVDAATINQEKRAELNEMLGGTLLTNNDGTISLVVPDVYAVKKGSVLGSQHEVVEDKEKLKELYENLFKNLN